MAKNKKKKKKYRVFWFFARLQILLKRIAAGGEGIGQGFGRIYLPFRADQPGV